MKAIKLTSLLLLGLFISGCATGQLGWTPEKREAITTKAFQKDYNNVYTAVLNAFEAKGFAIATSDKENGIISTDYRSARSVIMGSGRSKISARVSKIDEASTLVRLNLHCEGYSDVLGINVTDDLVGEREYQALFDAINSQLK